MAWIVEWVGTSVARLRPGETGRASPAAPGQDTTYAKRDSDHE